MARRDTHTWSCWATCRACLLQCHASRQVLVLLTGVRPAQGLCSCLPDRIVHAVHCGGTLQLQWCGRLSTARWVSVRQLSWAMLCCAVQRGVALHASMHSLSNCNRYQTPWPARTISSRCGRQKNPEEEWSTWFLHFSSVYTCSSLSTNDLCLHTERPAGLLPAVGSKLDPSFTLPGERPGTSTLHGACGGLIDDQVPLSFQSGRGTAEEAKLQPLERSL